MQIKFGTTRLVFLVGDKAFKVGKIRFIRLFFRMIVFPFLSKGNHNRFYAKYGTPLWRALWHYLTAGLSANRIEYEYYQTNRDYRVMPTIAEFLDGWVIIQDRGEPVSREELSHDNPFLDPPLYAKFVEIEQPWQFCRNSSEKIVLVDYGRKETRDALASTRRNSELEKAA